jgi:hypothetical protein
MRLSRNQAKIRITRYWLPSLLMKSRYRPQARSRLVTGMSGCCYGALSSLSDKFNFRCSGLDSQLRARHVFMEASCNMATMLRRFPTIYSKVPMRDVPTNTHSIRGKVIQTSRARVRRYSHSSWIDSVLAQLQGQPNRLNRGYE